MPNSSSRHVGHRAAFDRIADDDGHDVAGIGVVRHPLGVERGALTPRHAIGMARAQIVPVGQMVDRRERARLLPEAAERS